MKTRAETLAYAKGYYAGSLGRWPDHHPPTPPDALAAEIVKSAVELANHVASWSGAFGEDDEFSQEMKPLLEAVDRANCKLTDWIRSPVTQPTEPT